MPSLKERSQSDAHNEGTMCYRSIKETKWALWKNALVLGLIFCLLFIAYGSLAELQSSLFIEDGLGVICQAITYATFIFASLLLPTLTITTFGHKWALLLSLYSYVIWMAANGCASWLTMTVSSFLVGISAAPLWTVFGSYINILATRYAALTGKTRTSALALFFGIVIAMFKSSRIFGSLLCWFVLHADLKNATLSDSRDTDRCGANDCPGENTTNVNYAGPPMTKLWILVGCLVAVGISTILITLFCLDNPPPDWYIAKKARSESASRMVVASVLSAGKLHGNINQLLLIPLFTYHGMIMSFSQADITKSYVTCALGIWMVGLIMLPNSIVAVPASLLSGKLGKTVSTLTQLSIAFLLDTGILLLCLFWIPHQDQLTVFLLISSVTGLTDAVWQAQTNALVGTIFPTNEAAYANYRVWNAAGHTVLFATKNALCVRTRIYLLLSVLVLNMICTVLVHRRYKATKKPDVNISCHVSTASESETLSQANEKRFTAIQEERTNRL